ncbi:hypothetical protein M5K25_011234 [Dendrobium thyrsiflorum]|uniref:Uncharacterized protein n=1 Tax=Dendrobium thyrsiflorum TaxID=117978 RepID=A0ABD0V2X3_DENTH
MATTNQPPVVTPDGRLEELQEPALITSKEDEIVSRTQIENLISQKAFRRKSALKLEVDPRLLSSKNSVAGGPSSSKKKSSKYFKDQKGKHKSGSKSQKEKKKKLARQKTMIQKYINSTYEYQQPPRRPIMLEEYMADLFLDSESEEEGSIPIETCRVISKRGGRAAKGRSTSFDICKADVKMSSREVHRTPAPFTDSDEELHFPDEESDHKGKKILKERCSKLGSSSDTEEVEDMESSKNSQAEASSSSEVTQIQLRSGKQVSLPQKKIKDKEKNIQLNEAVVPQESLKPKIASANVNYNILSHLRKLHALLSIYDALLMSKDLQETLIKALQNPEQYEAFFAEKNMKEALHIQNTATITFCDNDLLLGTTDHNRPLYFTAESNNVEINRILIDPANHANKVRCSRKPSTEGEEEEFIYQPKGTKKSQEEGDPGPSSISKKLQKVSISMIRKKKTYAFFTITSSAPSVSSLFDFVALQEASRVFLSSSLCVVAVRLRCFAGGVETLRVASPASLLLFDFGSPLAVRLRFARGERGGSAFHLPFSSLLFDFASKEGKDCTCRFFGSFVAVRLRLLRAVRLRPLDVTVKVTFSFTCASPAKSRKSHAKPSPPFGRSTSVPPNQIPTSDLTPDSSRQSPAESSESRTDFVASIPQNGDAASVAPTTSRRRNGVFSVARRWSRRRRRCSIFHGFRLYPGFGFSQVTGVKLESNELKPELVDGFLPYCSFSAIEVFKFPLSVLVWKPTEISEILLFLFRTSILVLRFQIPWAYLKMYSFGMVDGIVLLDEWNAENAEKLKKYEAVYSRRLKAKYFSMKTLNGEIRTNFWLLPSGRNQNKLLAVAFIIEADNKPSFLITMLFNRFLFKA